MAKATYRFCKFHERGLECDRASMAEPHKCGCKPHQLATGILPYGRSRSHLRKIRKQLVQRDKRRSNEIYGKFAQLLNIFENAAPCSNR